MKRALMMSAAVAAVLTLPGAAMAQSSSPQTNAPNERRETAPGQNRPAATTPAPGKSEAAPGQTRPDVSTNAPGRSETAPGQTRTGDTTAPGRSESAPGQNRPPANTAAPGRSESAPGQNRTNTTESTTDRPAGSPAGSSAQQNRPGSEPAGRNQADQGNRSGATAGAASGENATVQLNAEQRTRVNEAFAGVNVRPVTNVKFNVSVGTVIRDRVDFHPLPPAIVSIVPQFRGYEYIVVRDDIVIVEPRTRRIVYVMDRSGGRSHASLTISSPMRVKVKQALMTGPRINRSIQIEDGMTVPPDIELRPITATVIQDVPELRSYRYFVLGEQVILVEPQSRRVIEVIR